MLALAALSTHKNEKDFAVKCKLKLHLAYYI